MTQIPLTLYQATDPHLVARLRARGFEIRFTEEGAVAVKTASRMLAAETDSEQSEATPVKVVQERRDFVNGVVIGGVVVGVLATVFGNVLSELILDDLRQAHRKFGYESSWWERLKKLKFWKLGE
jgi:hypothetical protein